jgi:hypothetical protein
VYLPAKVRITQEIGTPPGGGGLKVELVLEDGTVCDSSPLIPLPLSKEVTYGNVFAEVKLQTQWEGVPTLPAGSVQPGTGGPKGAPVLTSKPGIGGPPKR